MVLGIGLNGTGHGVLVIGFSHSGHWIKWYWSLD